jgi:acyl-CoA synthetase (AMP-forming)/AMP-acid ligase II
MTSWCTFIHRVQQDCQRQQLLLILGIEGFYFFQRKISNSHHYPRFVFIVAGIHYVSAFKSEDVFYTPLPLYHTAGGIMSVGQALLFGATVVIRKKFSATQFFVDCQKYKCTVSSLKI